MKNVWFFVVVASLIACLVANPETCLSAMSKAGESAVKLSLKLLGIYAIWLGFLAIVDEAKLTDKIAFWLSPIIDFLFGKNVDENTKKCLALNISSNILGVGNASTPMGIKAMQGLSKNSMLGPMVMLVVLNATSLQLLPTTIISLRASFGSESSSSIILPALITTTLTTILGVLLVKLFYSFKFQKRVVKKWR